MQKEKSSLFLVSNTNKKVLLRERKRHTARRVASARYAALSNGWGRGYPSSPGGGGGTPPTIQTWSWGGVPSTIQTWDGVPPTIQTWDGVPPRPGMGYSPTQTWDGVPPPPRPGTGYSPPRPGMGYPSVKVWTDKQTENSTFPHPSDTGGNYRISRDRSLQLFRSAGNLLNNKLYVHQKI